MMIRTLENVMQHYGCTSDTAQRYIDLRDEGYPQHQAALMAGLTDPPSEEPEGMTPSRVLNLKKEATRLKKDQGLKHAAALETIAQREGFGSWQALIAAAGGSDAVHEAKFDRPPTEAQVQRAERHADRLRRYGRGAIS